MRKFKSDELQRRIDEVLFYVWDPIGVSPNPDARCEYSSYVLKILELLNDGRDTFKVVKYLCDIESGMLALPANEERAHTVTKLLFSHKEAIEEGRA